MTHITHFTPPPRKLTALVAALLAALVLPPAAANVLFTGSCDRALNPTADYQVAVGNVDFPGDGMVATGAPTGQNVTLVDRIVTGNHTAVIGNTSGTRLQVQGMPGGTADFVRGGKNNCVAGSTKPQFYSEFSFVYEHTQPLGMTIKACPYRWLAPKCSRTISIGGISYTANRGAPPCGDNTQQTDPGGFTVMPRTTGVPDGSTFNTFAPGPNCAPPEWPTKPNKDAYMGGDERFPPYARWCDFTVTVP